MTTGIGSTCAKNICIGSTCTIGTWIECTSVGVVCIGCICTRGAYVRGIEPRTLIVLGVTLAGLGINDCSLQLFVELIFALIDGVSY